MRFAEPGRHHRLMTSNPQSRLHEGDERLGVAEWYQTSRQLADSDLRAVGLNVAATHIYLSLIGVEDMGPSSNSCEKDTLELRVSEAHVDGEAPSLVVRANCTGQHQW